MKKCFFFFFWEKQPRWLCKKKRTFKCYFAKHDSIKVILKNGSRVFQTQVSQESCPGKDEMHQYRVCNRRELWWSGDADVAILKFVHMDLMSFKNGIPLKFSQFSYQSRRQFTRPLFFKLNKYFKHLKTKFNKIFKQISSLPNTRFI